MTAQKPLVVIATTTMLFLFSFIVIVVLMFLDDKSLPLPFASLFIQKAVDPANNEL